MLCLELQTLSAGHLPVSWGSDFRALPKLEVLDLSDNHQLTGAPGITLQQGAQWSKRTCSSL